MNDDRNRAELDRSREAVEFEVMTHDDDARLGKLTTPHGAIETPVFMPVATQGTVKTLTTQQVEDVGASIVLSNTYHLMLRPGADRVERLGGLHRMMAWNKAILTDSGGFQVASLSALRRIDDDGVVFRSHIDGSLHALSPEKAVAVQQKLGADIAMVLDECVLYPSDESDIRRASDRSLSWAKRCLAVHRRPDQALFGIVQGGVSPSLRRDNARALIDLDFPGYGIGGLAVGEPSGLTRDVTEIVTEVLPADKPRYLMGAGTPSDLIESVARGVDMFDCVLPTRNARNGTLFTSRGKLALKNQRFADDDGPLDPDCTCYTCQSFSRAYLRHLLVSKEMTGLTLNTIHNLHFYLALMQKIREAIAAGGFSELRRELGALEGATA